MSGFSISYAAKRMYIRDKQIMSRYERARNRALRRLGMIIRQFARKLIKKNPAVKYRKVRGSDERVAVKQERKVSTPGNPPIDHTWPGDPISIRNIQYGFDGKTLIIGPIGFGRDPHPITERLEYGDDDMAARPYMNPALEEKYHELNKSLEKFGVI